MSQKGYDIPTLHTITTANKNIHSFFMRTDVSYFVKESECYPAYKKDDDRVLVLRMVGDEIEIYECEDSNDEYEYDDREVKELEGGEGVNDRESNVEAYNSMSNIRIAKNIKKYRVDGLFEGNVLAPVSSTHLLFKLYNSLPCLKDSFVCLVFKDTLRRSELLFLINVMLNYKSGKGMLLLPESLALCMSLTIQSAIVIHSQEDTTYISVIEDYVLTEVKKLKEEKASNITLFRAEEEFVDEFDSWEEFKLDKTFRCDVCGTWFVKESIFMHVIKKHIKNGKCECRKNKNSKSEEVVGGVDEREIEENNQNVDDSTNGKNTEDRSGADETDGHSESFNRSDSNVSFLNVETIKGANINDSIKQHVKDHITYIFKGNSVYEKIGHFLRAYITKERLKKINTIITDEVTIARMKEQFSNFNYVDIGKANAWRGAKDLMRIDVAKELWMTDREWNATRLRVLKEKLLFYL